MAGKPTTPSFLVDADGNFSENWRESLDEDIREEKCLDVVTNFPSAIKQLVHAQKGVGKNKIAVPTDKSDASEWDAFYTAVGRPKTVDDYKVDVPEDFKEIFTDDRMSKARAIAHELGVTQKQFEGWVKHEINSAMELLQKEEKDEEAARAIAESKLKEEFGQAYQERMNVANRLLAEAIPNEESRLNFLEKYGSDPDFIRFASVVGARLVESKAMVAELTQNTPGQAREKIQTLQATEGYLNGTLKQKDPVRHEQITNELRDLYKQLYPEQGKDRAESFVKLG